MQIGVGFFAPPSPNPPPLQTASPASWRHGGLHGGCPLPALPWNRTVRPFSPSVGQRR